MNCKTSWNLFRQRFTCNGINARGRRSVLQPRFQLSQRIIAAACDDFHAAIGKVLGVTRDANPKRLFAGGGAEEHALHATADNEAHARHGQCPDDLGDGLPATVASAMACANSLAVTGPMKGLAMWPSGATR